MRLKSNHMTTTEAINLEAALALAEELRGDYLAVRVLPDGSVAGLLDLFFTRAICLGMNREGWTRRFCFADRALAFQRFLDLQSEDDVPAGFVAQR